MTVLASATCCSKHTEPKDSANQQTSPAEREQKGLYTPDPCREFAQDFYDWYLPNTTLEETKKNQSLASDFALQHKRQAFSDELFRALEQDSMAQSKAGELVGLDFDPFLASQDPDAHYEVRKVRHDGDRCWAEVHGIGSSAPRNGPDVVAELVLHHGTWRFLNFHYPQLDNSDLLGILKSLAKGRQETTK